MTIALDSTQTRESDAARLKREEAERRQVLKLVSRRYGSGCG